MKMINALDDTMGRVVEANSYEIKVSFHFFSVSLSTKIGSSGGSGRNESSMHPASFSVKYHFIYE